MIYQTDILRIVPFTRAHFSDEYRNWFHDRQTCKYNSHGLFPYTAAAMEAFVHDIEQGSMSRIVWAIECRYEHLACSPGSIPGPLPPMIKDWKHIGNVSLQSINWQNRSAELAIVLGCKRGRGYGLQACQWTVDHAFLRLGLNRVWTGTAATNIAMQKVCKHIGMTAEGQFQQGMFLDGEFVDVIAFGIIASEYFSKKESR